MMSRTAGVTAPSCARRCSVNSHTTAHKRNVQMNIVIITYDDASTVMHPFVGFKVGVCGSYVARRRTDGMAWDERLGERRKGQKINGTKLFAKFTRTHHGWFASRFEIAFFFLSFLVKIKMLIPAKVHFAISLMSHFSVSATGIK